MNGAHALVQTLVNADVDVCFVNPGTSEMHFVTAVDDVPAMRTVLALFEGVATGAADGYARMAEKPAATLLHLGAGLSNGMANLHNARRARIPLINIVGDHATYHAQYDALLQSDIEKVASSFSGWVGRPSRVEDLVTVTSEAISAALGPPATIATLILPADVSWSEGAVASPPPAVRPTPVGYDDGVVDEVAKLLSSGRRCMLLLGNRAVRSEPLSDALRVAEVTGASILSEISPGRRDRGAGFPDIERLEYRVEAATLQLAGVEHLILVDAHRPALGFAYPNVESGLVPAGCEVHVLSAPGSDPAPPLAALADKVGASGPIQLTPASRPERPTGALTPASAAAAVGAVLPEGAVVVDESITCGLFFEAATVGAPPHDWLRNTGGAIGMGLPLAVGAAVAVPDRRVIGLQADGSAMYTIQALWTMARENLDITTVILNNGSYAILREELRRVGANTAPKALDMVDLSRPRLDFVALANAQGVEAERATTAEGLVLALEHALSVRGPRLVEAML